MYFRIAMNNQIAITTTCDASLEKARKLSLHLQLPLIIPNESAANFRFLLTVTPNRLELRENSLRPTKPIFVDFLSPQINYRVKHGGGKNQLIAKAVGVKNKKTLTVLDATAGLGIDAFVLASLGCVVTMLERCKVVAALLTDGLERLKSSGHNLRLNLKFTQATTYIEKISRKNQDKPEVIYLDPMYPKRAKSALNKKSMRILHDLVGDDSDATNLLTLALTCAQSRVVVKRPRCADYLGNIKPDLQFFSSGSSRYDVYLSKIFMDLKNKEE